MKNKTPKLEKAIDNMEPGYYGFKRELDAQTAIENGICYPKKYFTKKSEVLAEMTRLHGKEAAERASVLKLKELHEFALQYVDTFECGPYKKRIRFYTVANMSQAQIDVIIANRNYTVDPRNYYDDSEDPVVPYMDFVRQPVIAIWGEKPKSASLLNYEFRYELGVMDRGKFNEGHKRVDGKYFYMVQALDDALGAELKLNLHNYLISTNDLCKYIEPKRDEECNTIGKLIKKYKLEHLIVLTINKKGKLVNTFYGPAKNASEHIRRLVYWSCYQHPVHSNNMLVIDANLTEEGAEDYEEKKDWYYESLQREYGSDRGYVRFGDSWIVV